MKVPTLQIRKPRFVDVCCAATLLSSILGQRPASASCGNYLPIMSGGTPGSVSASSGQPFHYTVTQTDSDNDINCGLFTDTTCSILGSIKSMNGASITLAGVNGSTYSWTVQGNAITVNSTTTVTDSFRLYNNRAPTDPYLDPDLYVDCDVTIN